MRQKQLTYVVLSLLVLLAVAYWWSAASLGDGQSALLQARQKTLGPGYFPTILAVALLLLCAFSAVKTWKESNDETVRILSPGPVIGTIAIIIAFALLWPIVGHFYVVELVTLLTLMFMYSPRPRRSVRTFGVNVLTASGVTAVSYVVFDLVLATQFT